MLLERRFLVRMPIAAQSVAQIEAAPVKLEKNEKKKKTFIGSSAENSFNTMPD